MNKIKPVTREQAIKVINTLFEEHFGSEKGSNDAYFEFMEKMKFVEFDDDGNTIGEAPGQYEFLIALGVQPQEIVDVLGINHQIFTKSFCVAYGAKKPKKTINKEN